MKKILKIIGIILIIIIGGVFILFKAIEYKGNHYYNYLESEKNFENDKNYDSDIFTEEELAEHISNKVTLEEQSKDDEVIQETKKEIIKTNVISFKHPESASLIPKFLEE